MKDKLFNALKQAYPQLGLSDEILRHHASMLAATVSVTDENIGTIVEGQKDYLQGLQAENDKRVTNATATAKAKADAEKQAAIDEAVKAALETERERVKKEAEDAAKKAEEEKKKAEEEKKKAEQAKEEPEFMKAFREELAKKEAERQKATTDLQAKLDELLKKNDEQGKTIDSLKTENDNMKAEQAKVERANLIKRIATELGIPDWRTEEGFAIAADADEAGIREALGKVANNIKVNTMQGGGSHILDDNKQVTKEEADSIVNQLMP